MYPNLELMLGQKLRELLHVRRFTAGVKNPRAAQEQKLLSIIRANEESAFGRKHNFNGIRSIKDFQAAVPVAC